MQSLLFIIGLACAIAGHFLLPWLLRRLSDKRFTYREYLFQSLVPGELAMLTREHFDTHTPDLTSLGYVALGDFLQQDKPLWQVERLFLHRDGRSFAGLVQCCDTRCVSFLSVLADGTYLESANIAPPHLQPEEDIPFRIQCFPRASARDVCARHKAEILRREPQNGPPRSFGADEAREVIEYGRLLSYQDLYAKKICPQPPPTPVAPGESCAADPIDAATR